MTYFHRQKKFHEMKERRLIFQWFRGRADIQYRWNISPLPNVGKIGSESLSCGGLSKVIYVAYSS